MDLHQPPLPSAAHLGPPPGFALDAHGKPLIGLDGASLYAYGHLLRSTENLILELFSRGLLSGTTHTCLGQELCQMAVVRALDHPEDVVLSNHRNHGHFLTYSGDFLGLVGEVMGRSCGVCAGYGGSQHIASRHFHSNGVQAGMTAIGVGEALARRLRGSNAMVATIVGDGTLGEGLLYESMNLASVWGLPVLFVVENNGIAQTTETRHVIGGTIEARGQAFGLRTLRVDDSAPDFASRVDAFVREVRASRCAAMLVIDTRRLGPHSKGDDLRSDAEKAQIAARDPLAALGANLPEAQRLAIEARNQAYLAEVEREALASPESTFAIAPSDSFRREPVRAVPALAPHSGNVRGALNSALRHLLTTLPDAIVLGEDLHDPYGGAFKVTAGLSSDFPERVVSTPISEAGITGAAIGLALAGARPIVEIMFADFLTLCADQLYNHAVKFPGMFASASVPLVLRTPCGGRRGYGPTHSQSPENIFVSVPGLTVVYPSHRHDVGGLLVDAVTRWPNPTLFLEHKLLYSEACEPGGYTALPAAASDTASDLFPTLALGPADADVVIVAFGGILPIAEKAARLLSEQEGLRVRTIVPALLSPLPRDGLLDALLDAPCVVIAEESHHEFGVSAEILASLAEAGYTGIASRLGMPGVPIASARSLERDQLVDETTIAEHILALIG